MPHDWAAKTGSYAVGRDTLECEDRRGLKTCCRKDKDTPNRGQVKTSRWSSFTQKAQRGAKARIFFGGFASSLRLCVKLLCQHLSRRANPGCQSAMHCPMMPHYICRLAREKDRIFNRPGQL